MTAKYLLLLLDNKLAEFVSTCLTIVQYTSNPIESFNKKYKKNIRKKEQFPNEDSLDRFTCAIASDYNKQFESRQMKGFSKCSYELQQLFEERYGSKG